MKNGSVYHRILTCPYYNNCIGHPCKSLENFNMTSCSPYWCTKTIKRWQCWCSNPILCICIDADHSEKRVLNRFLGFLDFPYLKHRIRDFPYLKLGIGDFPHLKLGIWDFKTKSWRDSGLIVCAEGGMPKITLGITEVYEVWRTLLGTLWKYSKDRIYARTGAPPETKNLPLGVVKRRMRKTSIPHLMQWQIHSIVICLSLMSGL